MYKILFFIFLICSMLGISFAQNLSSIVQNKMDDEQNRIIYDNYQINELNFEINQRQSRMSNYQNDIINRQNSINLLSQQLVKANSFDAAQVVSLNASP